MKERRHHGFALLVLVALGCQKRSTHVDATSAPESTAPLAKPRCFSVLASANTAATREVFEAKGCQGGGVTWGGLLRLLVEQYGSSEPVVATAASGWTGDVQQLTWAGGSTRWSVDDEGESAMFCADSARLAEQVDRKAKSLNADRKQLEQLMATANLLALECLPPGTKVEDLLGKLPPPPLVSPAEATAREAGLAQLRRALEQQRTWCFDPRGSVSGGKGGFTLHPDGSLTTFRDGQTRHSGTWRFVEDGRIEALLPGHVTHFDASANGGLGFNHTEGREELKPCAEGR